MSYVVFVYICWKGYKKYVTKKKIINTNNIFVSLRIALSSIF